MPNDKKNINDLVLMTKAGTGYYGADYIADTNSHTPTTNYDYFSIICTSEAVIDTVSGDPDISGKTLKDNAIVYGRWSSIKLTSGEIIAYKIPTE